MRLGYLDLGDGAGISASLEDEVLTLSGSLDGGGLGNSFGPRAQLASLRSGLILPLYAEVSDKYQMNELDGLYELGQVGYEYSPGMPWAMTLRRLAAGSVLGETSLMSAMFPQLSPVAYSAAWARYGLPGYIDALSGGGYQRHYDTPHGRVHLVASPAGPGEWAAWSCQPPDYLAGSPRVEVRDPSDPSMVWWPLHGKAPRGVPTRVSNGLTGIGMPSQGSGWSIYLFNPDGTELTRIAIITSDGEALYHDNAWSLEVVRSDSEMVWMRAVQPRRELDGLTPELAGSLRTEVVMRRGVPGAWLSYSRNDITVTPSVATKEGITDTATPANNIGLEIRGHATNTWFPANSVRLATQKKVTVAGTGLTRSFGPVSNWRMSAGLEEFITRAWADPHATVLR